MRRPNKYWPPLHATIGRQQNYFSFAILISAGTDRESTYLHSDDFHDRHRWEDHGIADVGPLGRGHRVE